MKKKTVAKLVFGLSFVLTLSHFVSELEYKIAFDRKMKWKKKNRSVEEDIAKLMEHPHEELEIVNVHKDLLKGILFFSKTPSKKFVLLSHGYRNDGLHEFRHFLPFYFSQDVNVLVIDHQAHGKSEGTRITFGCREHEDLLQWMATLITLYGEDIEIFLHGISMGSSTVLKAIENLPKNVKGILADCGYASAKEQIIHTIQLNHIPLPRFSYRLIYNKLWHRLGADLKDMDLKKHPIVCQVPIKIIHGDQDTFVPLHNAFEIYQAIDGLDKELVVISNAKHAQSYICDPALYEKKILEILAN
ncbi:MAG: alpha/beta hydrolase [Bacillota bacterium]|nr:alpha/beta hydrolase [Bacillota bacterium]